MADCYLLECPSCQNNLKLTARQAGQTLTCPDCSTDVEAPMLGKLKALPVDQTQAPKEKQRSMSAAGRWLFTIGLGLAVVAGGAGWGLQRFASNLHTEINVDEKLVENEEAISTLPASEIYLLASAYEKNDRVGEYQEPAFVKNNIQGSILTNIAYGLYALAAAGLAMLLTAFVKQ